jgi:rhamnose utilization protein RhaD (predicted bifunctional aldolase and dehydrogenase)
MDKALSHLISISRQVGSLTAGAGGNTSVKTEDGNFMFIKAGGTALKDMSGKKGWRKLNLKKVRAIIADKTLAALPVQKRESQISKRLLAACADGKKINTRPSIEAHLHFFLDKFTIHLHPLAVGAFINSKNGKTAIEKLFAEEAPPPLWIPYADPGYRLAKKISRFISGYRKKHNRLPQILFLQKHGLIISSPDGKSALKLVAKVIKLCGGKLKSPKTGKTETIDTKTVKNIKQIIKKAFFESTGQNRPVQFFCDKTISAFSHSRRTASLLNTGPLSPEEVIYANTPAVWLEKVRREKIVSCIKNKPKPPLAFLVRNLGLFVIGDVKAAALTKRITAGSLFIRYNAQRFGGIIALTKSERDFIYTCGA